MSKDKIKLSVVLATYNEEENIGRCLKSVIDICDEIIVVDGKSVDETVRIAKEYKAKVITTTNKQMFHTNKQMAMDKAKGEWVLQLDADEVVDSELNKAMSKLIKKGSSKNAFWIKRRNIFLGKFLRKGGQYPDKVIRLYKNGRASLPQKNVHEQIRVDGGADVTGDIKGHLIHYTAPTFERYLTNANRYTTLTAKEFERQKVGFGIKSVLNYMMIRPFMVFIKIYFRHKGFMDGFSGFVFALFSGLHFPIAYMKYWRKRRVK